MNDNDLTAKKEIDQLKCCIKDLETKQLQLNGVATEKKELQNCLFNSSSFIEETIRKHAIIYSQFDENHKAIWSEYQKKKGELEKINCFKESLNVSIEQITKKIENVGCWLKQQEEKNSNLEENNFKLRQCLNEDIDSQTSLENDYQNQKVCLEKTIEELSIATCQLEDQTSELKTKKDENQKLKSEIRCIQDELLRKIDKFKFTELQLIRDKDVLKKNVQIKKNCNLELNNVICEHKNERQELVEALEKSNENINVLKQTVEKERVQGEKCIDEIRMEKSNVEKEKDELENKAEEQAEKLNECNHQNEQFKARLDELQYKLETAVKSGDEKRKISIEKMDRIDCEMKNLNIEMASKAEIVDELQEKLSEVERTRKTVGDEIYCLKRELDNLKQKQYIMSFNDDQNSHSSGSVNNVLVESELDAEKLRMRMNCDVDDDCDTKFINENDQNFEKLMTKFDMVLKYCKK